MEAHHTPVMVQEVIEVLQVRPGGSYIDCTLGTGGHALAVLGATEPPPRLLGLDLDTEALEAARQVLQPYAGHVTLAQGSFADLGEIAEENGFRLVDGVLFDLGLSSLQVDTQQRGFSFQREARLDMRFDPTQKTTAYEVVNRYPEAALADVIHQLGEEPRARRVARAIVRSRPVETTTQLADVVERALGRPARGRIHPATRTFQAIRMEVNQEMDNLQRGLDQAIGLLQRGGRVAVISYHSLEDRMVKNTFRREASGCICPVGTPECICGHEPTVRLVTRKIVRPSAEEVRSNPRSRSARLRAAERI